MRKGDEKKTGPAFLLFNGWPFGTRLAVSCAVMLFGLAVQALAVSNLGAIIIFTAGFLLAPRGIGNRPPAAAGKPEWKEVTIEEFKRAKYVSARCSRWGANALEIYCGKGVLSFTAVLAAVVVLFFFVNFDAELDVVSMFFVGNLFNAPVATLIMNVAALALPLWFLGGIDRVRNETLIMKIDGMMEIVNRLDAFPSAGWRVKYMFEMSKGEKGEFPTDARLSISPENGPESFIGIQVQMSLNDVQGKKYPYLYAVVIAKKEFGLPEAGFPGSKKDVFELESTDEVDVVVVRQKTSKSSGYHTSKKDMVRVFEAALAFADSALAVA